MAKKGKKSRTYKVRLSAQEMTLVLGLRELQARQPDWATRDAMYLFLGSFGQAKQIEGVDSNGSVVAQWLRLNPPGGDVGQQLIIDRATAMMMRTAAGELDAHVTASGYEPVGDETVTSVPANASKEMVEALAERLDAEHEGRPTH